MGFNFTIHKMAQIYLHEVTHERVAARNDHSNDCFVSENVHEIQGYISSILFRDPV